MSETLTAELTVQTVAFHTFKFVSKIVFHLNIGAASIKPLSGWTDGVTLVIGKDEFGRTKQFLFTVSVWIFGR